MSKADWTGSEDVPVITVLPSQDLSALQGASGNAFAVESISSPFPMRMTESVMSMSMPFAVEDMKTVPNRAAAIDISDGPCTRGRKRVCAYSAIALFAWCVVWFVVHHATRAASDLLWGSVGVGCLAATACGVFGYIHTTRNITHAVIVVYIGAAVVGIAICDLWALATAETRFWPAFLIFYMVASFGEVRDAARHALALATAAWVAVTAILSVTGTGGFVNGTAVPRVCDCATPPCTGAVGPAVVDALWYVVLLALGYLFTQVNCRVMGYGEDFDDTSAALLQQVVHALSVYDLERAEQTLQQALEERVRPDVHASLVALVGYLKPYRAFLPQSCVFDSENEVTDETMVTTDPPGDAASHAMFAEPTDNTFIDDDNTMTSSRWSAGGGAIVNAVHSPVSSRGPSPRSLQGSVHPAPAPIAAGASAAAAAAAASGPKVRLEVVVPRASSTLVSQMSPKSALRTNHLRLKRISLLNVTAWLPNQCLATDPAAYVHMHEVFLSTIVSEVTGKRGAVDTFLANRVTASFNASLVNDRYAQRALAALEGFAEVCQLGGRLHGLRTTGCIVSGSARVGVLGTESMRRPVILGSLPHLADQFDRVILARQQYQYLTDHQTYTDVCLLHTLRIVLDRIILEDLEDLQRSGAAPHAALPQDSPAPHFLNHHVVAAAGSATPPAGPHGRRRSMLSRHNTTGTTGSASTESSGPGITSLSSDLKRSSGQPRPSPTHARVACVAEDVPTVEELIGSDCAPSPTGSIDVSPRGMLSGVRHVSSAASSTLKLNANAGDEGHLLYEIMFEGRGRNRGGGGGGDPRTSFAGPPSDTEWMYELERAPGRRWELYNEAGKYYHKGGLGAAIAHLVVNHAAAEEQALFRSTVGTSCLLHLAPRLTTGSAVGMASAPCTPGVRDPCA